VLRRHREPPEVVLRALSGRSLSFRNALGVVSLFGTMAVIVILSVAASALVKSPIPDVVEMLTFLAVAVVVAASLVRRRIRVVVAGDRVIITNVWRSPSLTIDSIASVQEHVLRSGRGVWCLAAATRDGEQVPIWRRPPCSTQSCDA
jgi:hypothetical protein